MKRDVLLKDLRASKNLQVALDFLKIEDALPVAYHSVKSGVKVVEMGTPLLKAEGVKGLKILRSVTGNSLLLADTKTADAGDFEVLLAHEGGSDIMTVLGAMDDSTIVSAVKMAREKDILVQVDLINVPDVVKRANEVTKLGADIVGLHVGIDVQKKRGITVASLRREIMEIASTGVLVSVAGGLTPEKILEINDLPISIFVVGSYITRSDNPGEAVKRCLSAMGQ